MTLASEIQSRRISVLQSLYPSFAFQMRQHLCVALGNLEVGRIESSRKALFDIERDLDALHLWSVLGLEGENFEKIQISQFWRKTLCLCSPLLKSQGFSLRLDFQKDFVVLGRPLFLYLAAAESLILGVQLFASDSGGLITIRSTEGPSGVGSHISFQGPIDSKYRLSHFRRSLKFIQRLLLQDDEKLNFELVEGHLKFNFRHCEANHKILSTSTLLAKGI